MSKFNQQNVDLFSFEHLTYINQIFGDERIREIITESYAPRDWYFAVVPTGEEFENSSHHVLKKEGKNGETDIWCSVDKRFQNTNINKNDTLCQSYSLMKYLNKHIYNNMKKRQKEMIKMYRNIMVRPDFKEGLQERVEEMNKKIKKLNKKTKKKTNPDIWRDYTLKKKTYLNKDFTTLYDEILSILDKWEKYGYWYFIKDGKCPN